MTRGEKYEATHSTSALMLQARRLCFHVLAIVDRAAINIVVHVSF